MSTGAEGHRVAERARLLVRAKNNPPPSLSLFRAHLALATASLTSTLRAASGALLSHEPCTCMCMGADRPMTSGAENR